MEREKIIRFMLFIPNSPIIILMMIYVLHDLSKKNGIINGELITDKKTYSYVNQRINQIYPIEMQVIAALAIYSYIIYLNF